jgi:hypothetical protein
MRLLVDGVPIAGGIVGAAAEIEWQKPTRPGEVSPFDEAFKPD